MKDTIAKFSGLSIALHWLIAAGVISMLALGLYMESYEVFFLYPIHKSVGILLFMLVLWRIGRRVTIGWQPPAREFARAQFALARASHWTLITGTALMPISGMLMNVAGGRGLAVFGVVLLAPNRDASGEILALSEALGHFAHTVHAVAGKVLIAVIVLHFCAAMKHHFFDKDNVLRRMLGIG